MSINRITFFKEFYSGELFLINNPYTEILQFQDTIELTKVLSNLEIDKVYVVTFDFVRLMIDLTPTIRLSEPILITKNSTPRILSEFIQNKITLACNSFNLDDSLLEYTNYGPGVIMKYKEINLF